MKRIFIFLIIALFSDELLFSQNVKPFTVKGQLANLNKRDDVLYLSFLDENYNPVIDSAIIDQSGNFYLSATNITKPVTAKLYSLRSTQLDIFIAPGYNLTLTGDDRSYKTIYLTRKIGGYGSKANQYFIKRDSVLTQLPVKDNFTKLSEPDFWDFINTRKRICDSVARVIFDHGDFADVNFTVFKKNVTGNINFERSYFIVCYADSHHFDYGKSVVFVKDNIDQNLQNNLYDDSYMDYSWYRSLMGFYYLYLEDLDCRKDSSMCNNKNDYNIKNLEKIASVYKGKIKEQVLSNVMKSAIEYSRTPAELDSYKAAFPQYILMINDEKKKADLNKFFVNSDADMQKIKPGMPAPQFTAVDSLERSYSLSDFMGKVVLVDLWASWCGPCRGETPFLKKIEEKYKNDNRISFISIAVNDKLPNWKAAMKQDKVTGLQLFDKSKTVVSGYFAYSIPKFVLIDKDGKVVTFDAPQPHKTADLEKMLNAEIAK